jgi:hypothetical protein
MGNNTKTNRQRRESVRTYEYKELSDEEKFKIVLKKLEENGYWKKKSEIETIARRLSSIEILKETYLSSEFATVVKLVEEENNFVQKSTNKKDSFFFNSTVSEETKNIENNETLESENEECITKDDLILSKLEHQTLEKEIKIKLVITEIATTKFKKFEKKIVGPLLNVVDLTPELGNLSSLTHPTCRNFSHSSYHRTMDDWMVKTLFYSFFQGMIHPLYVLEQPQPPILLSLQILTF